MEPSGWTFDFPAQGHIVSARVLFWRSVNSSHFYNFLFIKVEHNCVRELRAVVRDQGECLTKAQQDLADMRLVLSLLFPVSFSFC